MKTYFLAVCLMLSFSVYAQEDTTAAEVPEKRFRKENLFIGGNFGLAFGDYTLINLSPQLGYRFNRFLAAGVGINGQFVSYKQRSVYTGDPIQKESWGVAGLNLFGRVYPLRQFMLQAQPEMNYVSLKRTVYYPSGDIVNRENHFVPSLLLGGGLVLPSDRSAFIISLLYDVLQKPNNPYGKRPVLNIGYNVGLSGR